MHIWICELTLTLKVPNFLAVLDIFVFVGHLCPLGCLMTIDAFQRAAAKCHHLVRADLLEIIFVLTRGWFRIKKLRLRIHQSLIIAFLNGTDWRLFMWESLYHWLNISQGRWSRKYIVLFRSKYTILVLNTLHWWRWFFTLGCWILLGRRLFLTFVILNYVVDYMRIFMPSRIWEVQYIIINWLKAFCFLCAISN